VVADPDLDDDTRQDTSARDVERWVRTLRDGGRRSRPRTLKTVWAT
jgi:hypothetical protein